MGFDNVLHVLIGELLKNGQSTLAMIAPGHHEHDEPIPPGQLGAILELRQIAFKMLFEVSD